MTKHCNKEWIKMNLKLSESFCGFTCLQLAENSKDDSEQTTSFFAREGCQIKNNASIIGSINGFEAVCIINITSSSNMLFQSLRI